MLSKLIKASCFAVTALSATTAFAQSFFGSNTAVNEDQAEFTEQYIPSTWIDPDGCEHWVFDDGAEGYMTARRNRDGSPVCHRQEVCGVIPSDTLFALDKHAIPASAAEQLRAFFSAGHARTYLIYGHTDARASDEYNMALSQRRADAVAAIARSAGANIAEARGFGERNPIASGNSESAYQQNRRVEIICLK